MLAPNCCPCPPSAIRQLAEADGEIDSGELSDVLCAETGEAEIKSPIGSAKRHPFWDAFFT
ncbi:MAG: hypothetical protein A3C61_03840 [Candidatus Yanofskybacteria bacterium RIFCSPHIGHO2_02_FULL_39_10]|uniref:Uncharacterized protein n=1 Tax=Candidatus Yanofskybacteria bacterium RIFCSPHIGHO2_02_FULL_39_10 TaxID=1802674 RepID=A0A1F8FA03_9BACT|nr:MAG: hypothetical protein A3C61_03840 [Candidatus Yanofskybacteria bacterium RIFCSPHIGHO2_02_FULL_39_10]